MTKTARGHEEQLSRLAGIVRRTMDSMRAGYQRRSSESEHEDNFERDLIMLDVSQYANIEEMLGSLAQFAANKSHSVVRLQHDLRRKAVEISELEQELQQSWNSNQKVQSFMPQQFSL